MPTAETSYTPTQSQVAGVLACIRRAAWLVQALWGEGEPLKIGSVAVYGDGKD